MNRLAKLYLSIIIISCCGIINAAQPDSTWTGIGNQSNSARSTAAGVNWVKPDKYAAALFDDSQIRNTVRSAPEDTVVPPSKSQQIISVPKPDGTFEKFLISRVETMEAPLAAQFPDIQTFKGVGIDDPTATLRADITIHGFRGSVENSTEPYLIDPLYQKNAKLHVSYYLKDAGEQTPLICNTESFPSFSGPVSPTDGTRTAFGTDFRTLRLAMATTGEYTAGVGGTVPDGMAAVTSVVNRLNQLFEREVGVRFLLVANNNLLIYTDGGTDPYTDNDTPSLLNENQATLPGVIGGDGNYDIGHVLNSTGSGQASGSVVCNNATKARGTSAIRGTGPMDNQSVYHTAHEVGHQFGAGHTFNGTQGNCNAGNYSANDAYEPGSGTTLLAYPGTCSTDNIRIGKEAYFHRRSLDSMIGFIQASVSCAVTVSSGNTPPTVNAGTDIVVPVSTPFKLKATGSDVDNDSIFYCWEQFDLGAARALGSPDDGTGPLFRSRFPSINPARYFPLNPASPDSSEILPTVANRDINFFVTGRDFRSGGGGTNDDSLVVHVIDAPAAPFRVTVGNTAGEIWAGTSRNITWDVAETDAQPFNIFNVNIMMSIDGGNTYPYLLAENTPNDGAETVNLPPVSSTQVRVRVEPFGSGVYDISDANVIIGRRIQVNPPSLSFGTVCPGSTPRLSVDIFNTGGADLTISNATITGSSNFNLLPTTANPHPELPVVISAGNHIGYTVQFNPGVPIGLNLGNLNLTSDDPDNPTLVIPLTATTGEPNIQTMIADSGNFGMVCLKSIKDLAITVTNTGTCDLSISSITSNNAEFQIPSVLTFPLTVQPGTSLQIPIRYAPTTVGSKTGILTINSNDGDQPAKTVNVSATTEGGKISVTPCPLDFGIVCPEDLATRKERVNICNFGGCPLEVTNVTLSNTEFTAEGLPTFPITLQAGSCFEFNIKFTPSSVGPKTATLRVESDDPVNPVVECEVKGETVENQITVTEKIAFSPTVISTQGECESLKELVVAGAGQCKVSITEVTITGTNADSLSLVGLPPLTTPALLSPGEVLGDGELYVKFAPKEMITERFHQAQINVTYISDPFVPTTKTVVVPMMGEATSTGFRVLVRAGGVPVDNVLMINTRVKKITQDGKNKNLYLKSRNATLRSVTAPIPFTPEEDFQYHIEYGALTNSTPIPPAEVVIKAKIKLGNKTVTRTSRFQQIDTCTFNKDVIIDF